MGLVGLMPFGVPYPSKSGLMNKHIVKHIVNITRWLREHNAVASYLGFETLWVL